MVRAEGLASVVSLILALEGLSEAGIDTTLLATTAGWTILLSVVLHGISAGPVAAWYGARAQRFASDSRSWSLPPKYLSDTGSRRLRPPTNKVANRDEGVGTKAGRNESGREKGNGREPRERPRWRGSRSCSPRVRFFSVPPRYSRS